MTNIEFIEHTDDRLVDGLNNFQRYVEMSKSFKPKTVFPSGQRAKVVNPNARPYKLNPPYINPQQDH